MIVEAMTATMTMTMKEKTKKKRMMMMTPMMGAVMTTESRVEVTADAPKFRDNIPDGESLPQQVVKVVDELTPQIDVDKALTVHDTRATLTLNQTLEVVVEDRTATTMRTLVMPVRHLFEIK